MLIQVFHNIYIWHSYDTANISININLVNVSISLLNIIHIIHMHTLLVHGIYMVFTIQFIYVICYKFDVFSI